MDEGSDNSEQLLEDEGSDREIDTEQVFGIGSNDLADVGEQLFGIEENDLENDDELVLEIRSNGHEDASEHVLEFGSRNVEDKSRLLEFEDSENDVQGSRMLEIENNDHENCGHDDQNCLSPGNCYPPPVVAMEFESYDDAYNYYNCYAKELGFAIRVKSSWTKRNSKEKRGAVLCCNCEGFKTLKEASSRRKETRTGCLAMIRLRLVESNRWRVDEVKLDHNHLFDPERAQNSKSHKKIDSGTKRKPEPSFDVEVRTIKLYRAPVADVVDYGSPCEREFSNHVERTKHLNLKKGDAQVISNFFCRLQLKDPNFFYVMDFNDEGYLRNVFWIDSRSRASYGYFGDVVALDTTSLSNKYEIPLLVFVGVNHHGHSVLLGCGLLADESLETYIWLLRAWLTCISGRPPQTILTDQSKTLQNAIADVLPRAHHRLCLPLVTQSIIENLGHLGSEVFQAVLSRIIYSSMKAEEFEMAWEDMIQRFAIRDNEWLRNLYEDRERWAPVYLKDTIFAGMFTFQAGESTNHFFHGYMNKQTSLKEFFDMYELVIQKKIERETFDDYESRESSPKLRTVCRYESQLSEVYTKEIFSLFQDEVEMISNCVGISQIHVNGPITTYNVKERLGDGNMVRNFEVMYDKIGVEVRCICSCFNFKGYLCRHALSVLNCNGVEVIPSQYILPRWRKDFKRLYVPDIGFDNVDISNPVQWFIHLHKRALHVVQEGMTSQDHYMVAWQAFKESLNKVHLVAEKST